MKGPCSVFAMEFSVKWKLLKKIKNKKYLRDDKKINANIKSWLDMVF